MGAKACGLLAALGLAARLSAGDITWDLKTAELTLDGKGRVARLKFADGSTCPPPGRAAFQIETDRGTQSPESVTLSADKLSIAFEGGAKAELTASCRDGFLILELKKLTSTRPVRRLALFSLAAPRDARVAHLLNAAYFGGHAVAVMAAEPNVRAFAEPFGSYHADRPGCKHEFVQVRSGAKVGHFAAEFSASSNQVPGGWSVRGRSLLRPLDLTGCKAIRAWVRGDGKGEQLKIQLYDGAGGYRDNYVSIDFDGWRQVTLTDCPINTLRYDSVKALNFYYNGLPASRSVSCVIDHVEAVVERDGRQQTILLEDFEAPDCPLWSASTMALQAETYQRHGIEPARLVVIACREEDFLPTVQRMEPAAGLPSPRPGGAWNKRSPWIKRSYFFLTSFSEPQFDQALAIARRGGFHMILIGQESWCRATGHYEINRKHFPDGLEGLQRTVRRFRDAGFRVGLHFLGPSIYPPDGYLTPLPDERLVKDAFVTLAGDVDDKAGFLPTTSPPEAFPAEDGGYEGRGAVLQVGRELVLYGARDVKPPFGFRHCARGYLGTRAAPHQKGERIAHVLKSYGYFLFDMDTSLLHEAADNFAQVANACGADMLYFDGSERLQGEHWYYNARLHKAFYDRLARKDLLLQASSCSHYSWHMMARSASADGHGDIKGYLDERSSWFDSFARDSLPLDIGWYYGYDTHATLDMYEYVLGATIGYDSSMSFQVSPAAAARHPFTGEILDLIRRYEKLRLGGRVSPEMRSRLRIDKALGGRMDAAKRTAPLDKRREYRLLERPAGAVFQRVSYEPWHEVTAVDGRSNVWRVCVRQGPARAGVWIHAQGGRWMQPGPAYRAADALALETFDDLAAYTGTGKGDAAVYLVGPGQGGSVLHGVTQRLESVREGAREGARCAVYTAASSLASAAGWSYIAKRFAKPLDLSWHKAIGFWMRGDGKGGSFKLQLRDDRGAVDYYVRNDFVGWRYQQLARPAKDTIDYANVQHLGLYYNGLPANTTVSCGIDDVKALRALDRRAVVNPYVELAGRRLSWKGTLQEGQYLVTWPGEPVRRYGLPLAQPKVSSAAAPDLALPVGEHSASFGCEGPILMPVRVRVTLQPPERHAAQAATTTAPE
jgi:hypothetical protein